MAEDSNFDIMEALMRSTPAPRPAPRLSPDLDCVACGACCVEAGEVPVRPDDPTPRSLTASIEGVRAFASEPAGSPLRRMGKAPGKRCVALAGEVGTSCSCSIYEARPAVCRTFARGSEGCHAAREVAEMRLRDLAMRPWGYGDAAELERQRREWA